MERRESMRSLELKNEEEFYDMKRFSFVIGCEKMLP
jgi:hypothetical protein